jgi:hypothetical protein
MKRSSRSSWSSRRGGFTLSRESHDWMATARTSDEEVLEKFMVRGGFTLSKESHD